MLAALEREARAAEAAGATQIERHEAWKGWGRSAEAEAKRVAEILRDVGKLRRSAEGKAAPSDSEGSSDGESEADVDANAEIMENARLRDVLQGRAPQDPPPVRHGSDAPHDLGLERQTSHVFYSLPHYDPLPGIRALSQWRDSFGSTAAHHAAVMGLRRALQALCDAGASRWATNKAGETPAALADGLSGLAPSRSVLHRACTKAGLLRPMVGGGDPAAAARLMGMAVTTPEGYRTPEILSPVKEALLQDRSGEALVESRGLLGECVHARAYMAVAMLDEGFGAKAARLELDRYLNALLAGPTDALVDPVVFYAHYSAWVAAGRPRGRRERLAAAHALTALRCFPAFAGEWVGAEDDVDEQVRREGLDDDEDAGAGGDEEEADSEDDDEPPGPRDPETEWREAKERHAMASAAMDRLMALTGLKAVKRSAIRIVKEVLLRRGRPAGIRAETSMNFLFVGNPGCGKTTVAKLLGAAMAELGFRASSVVEETSAQAILKVSPDPVAGFVALVKGAVGGTVFIDEAYRFSPNKAGGQPNASNGVLDYLLEAGEGAQRKRGRRRAGRA
jgi:hypothetical protein